MPTIRFDIQKKLPVSWFTATTRVAKKDEADENEATIKLLSPFMQCHEVVEKWEHMRGRFAVHVSELGIKV